MESISDLQIWNNAAFEDLSGTWGSSKSVFVANTDTSFDSVSGKENQSPELENRQLTSTPFKELKCNGVSEKLRVRVEKNIDEEIEEIESEISRLSSRLKALKVQKAAVEIVEKKGALERKQIADLKMGEENPVKSINKKQALRRGMSLGPDEIISAGARGRRGMSMGPSEILSTTNTTRKSTVTTTAQSRRKSCFFKLQEIDEEKVVESPNLRKAVTTITTKRNVKKEAAVLNKIQPKKLFTEGDKSVSNKKQLSRPGRVVPSRYNQTTASSQASAMRKRLLPENDQDRSEKKRSLSTGKSRDSSNNTQTASRVKKRWEIPSQIVVHDSYLEDEKSPHHSIPISGLLPRIRIAHSLKDSPRDSGPAKRVAELIGRKSFFAVDEDLRQALSYEEDDETPNE